MFGAYLVHHRHTASPPPSLDSDSRCLPLRHAETLVYNTRSGKLPCPKPWMCRVFGPGSIMETSWLSPPPSAKGIYYSTQCPASCCLSVWAQRSCFLSLHAKSPSVPQGNHPLFVRTLAPANPSRLPRGACLPPEHTSATWKLSL